MICLRHVSRSYPLGDQTFYAVKDVSLTITQGEFVAILGPSGCGKSSLLYLLGLLDRADSGSYTFLGEDVSHLTSDRLAYLRRQHIGFVFQQFGLLPRVSAQKNVAMPSIYRHGISLDQRAADLLNALGLQDRLHHVPSQLSGGQQQRVAIARALMNQPQLILADEPTGALDSKSSEEVLSIFQDLHRQGHTVVVITHDPDVAQRAQRILIMKDGELVSDTAAVGSRPVSISLGKTSPGENVPPGLAILSPHRLALHKLLNFARQGLSVLRANKARSALSILGILIGVAAVVTMLAVGGGAQGAIEKELAGLGSNLLMVRKGSGRMGGASSGAGSLDLRFSPDDAAAMLKQISSIASVTPNITGSVRASYGNRNWNTLLQGTGLDYPAMRSAHPPSGRFFSHEELKQKARVALVGQTVMKNLFPGEDPLGKDIRVQKILFKVIGTLPAKGASTFRDQDDIIITPYTTAQDRVFGKTSVDFFDVQVRQADQLNTAQDEIEALLLQRHRVPPSLRHGAIMVHNMADIQRSLTQTTKIVSLLLSVVAAIALIVGGIGIMNIMLVTVTERTREIGLRKAIGASDRDILVQFLVEAVLLSLIGGILGLSIGIVLTQTIAALAGWAILLSIGTLLLPMLFSSLVGIFFGLYPAWKAARLLPLAALRYE